MEPDQEKFEAWLHSAQPICKSPWVCWEAGLDSDEKTRSLVGTSQSEDGFNAWRHAVMSENIDPGLFDAYRAAIKWGQQHIAGSTALHGSPNNSLELDTVRPLRI